MTRSMDIAVAYIIQIVWFGDIPLWTSILGAFVVILAVFTMSMQWKMHCLHYSNAHLDLLDGVEKLVKNTRRCL